MKLEQKLETLCIELNKVFKTTNKTHQKFDMVSCVFYSSNFGTIQHVHFITNSVYFELFSLLNFKDSHGDWREGNLQHHQSQEELVKGPGDPGG